MKKKVVIVISILIVLLTIFIVTKKEIRIENTNETLFSKEETKKTKEFTSAEISCSTIDDEGMVNYSEPVEIDKKQINYLIQDIFEIIDRNNTFTFEYSGDYFEGNPILKVYLSNGEIMQVTAGDTYCEDDNGKMINLIEVAYGEDADWANSKMYISDKFVQKELINLFEQNSPADNLSKTSNSEDVSDNNEIFVELEDGRKGYVFCMDHFAG